MRLYPTNPIANCTAHRSFSKFARIIKNNNTPFLSQDNLWFSNILLTKSDNTVKGLTSQKSRQSMFITSNRYVIVFIYYNKKTLVGLTLFLYAV